jgi:hypothetical protein
MLNRLLPRVRVEITPANAASDLMRREGQRPTASFDLVPKELKAVGEMNDTGLLLVQPHPERLQDLARLRQSMLGFRPRAARDQPIVGVPGKPIPAVTHLTVKRSQKDITQQGRNNPALWRAPFGGKSSPIRTAARFEHAANQAQHPTVRDLLGQEGQQFLVIDRPEEIFQIGIDDPLVSFPELLPDLAQGVLG